jgi:hypothetical protein
MEFPIKKPALFREQVIINLLTINIMVRLGTLIAKVKHFYHLQQPKKIFFYPSDTAARFQ